MGETETMRPLVEPGPELTAEQVSRYSRHLLVPQVGMLGQRRLRNARVAVVGAGGLGCPALSYLVAAGVGAITLIDDDVVDVTNLQRQVLHRVQDVGTPKVDSAARALRELNPDTALTPLHTRLTRDTVRDVLSGHDVVLDGTDNFDTRYLVSDACRDLRLPLVWAAVLRFDAQISTFVPGLPESVTLRDLYPVPPRPEDVPSCAEAGVLGALVGQVGSIMAGEVVKLLAGFGEPLIGRVLLLDALTQRTREVPLRPVGDPPLRRHGESRDRAGRGDPVGQNRNGGHHATRELVPLRELGPAQVRALDLARVTLLDVREPAEHAMGTLPGAARVPVGEVLTWTRDDLPEGPVVVYCKAGPRAERAAAHLVRLGHPDVSVMNGGILGWIDQVDPSLPRY